MVLAHRLAGLCAIVRLMNMLLAAVPYTLLLALDSM